MTQPTEARPPLDASMSDVPLWANDVSPEQATICVCGHRLGDHIPDCEWTDDFAHFADKHTPYPCRGSQSCECPNYGGRWPE